jgi:transposase
MGTYREQSLVPDPPLSKRLLPLVPGDLAVVQVRPEPHHLVIIAAPRPSPAVCPGCRTPSRHPHGWYERTLSDLPWQGRPVSLRVRLRRLRCLNPACSRRTFSQSLPAVARPHARRSERLRDVQRHLGLALGGEPAARLAQRLAMPASPDTLLRLVRAGPIPPRPSPRVVGLDEWAWRRGRRYGTILVDLERNTVLDLLPDREAGSVAAWLRRHPGIEVVARDRAEVYGEGACQGAPAATQVADRWHLLCNLSGALQAVVGEHHAAIRAAAAAVQGPRLTTALADKAASRPLTAAQKRSMAKHEPRQARHAEMVRLRAAGASIAALARAFGMERKTVRRWLRGDGPPLWTKPPQPTVLDPHLPYLERRWSEGCRNAAALARELTGLGAEVHPRVVRAWATRRRRMGADALDVGVKSATISWKPPSVTRTARLLQQDVTGLAAEDRAFVEHLLARAPKLAQAVALAKRLAGLLRRHSDERLDGWLDEAQHSALARFADGLRQDITAVRGAIETPWSTSPVEGQIGRVKMIKRQMYGRASFELLRQRVLNTA